MNKQDDLLEYAWGIIANAGAGDWGRERADWKQAAERWRADYFKYLDAQRAPRWKKWLHLVAARV